MRRAQLATETRLIQTIDRITRLQIDQSGFVQERGLIDSRHKERIMTERAKLRAAMDEIRTGLDLVVKELALVGAAAGPVEVELDVTVIRSRGGPDASDFDTLLGPGDILTVRLVSAD